MMMCWSLLGGGRLLLKRQLAEGEVRPARASFSGASVGAVTLLGSGSAALLAGLVAFGGVTVGAPAIAASGGVGLAPAPASFSGATVGDPTLEVAGSAPIAPGQAIFSGATVADPTIAASGAAPLAPGQAVFSGATVGAPTLTHPAEASIEPDQAVFSGATVDDPTLAVGSAAPLAPDSAVFAGATVADPTLAASGSAPLAPEQAVFGGVTVDDPTVAASGGVALAPDVAAFGGVTVGAPSLAASGAAPLAPETAVYGGQTVGAPTLAIGSAAPLAPATAAFSGAVLPAITLVGSGSGPLAPETAVFAGATVGAPTLEEVEEDGEVTLVTSGSFGGLLPGEAQAATSVTQALNVSTGGAFLIVAISYDTDGNGGVTNTATYAGSSMTKIAELASNNGQDRGSVSIWRLALSATGSNNFVANFSNLSASVHIQFWVLADVASTTSVDASGTDNATAAAKSVSLTTSVANCLALGIAVSIKGGGVTGWTAQGGATENSDTAAGDFTVSTGVSKVLTASGSNSLATTANALNGSPQMVAIAVAPA